MNLFCSYLTISLFCQLKMNSFKMSRRFSSYPVVEFIIVEIITKLHNIQIYNLHILRKFSIILLLEN